MADPATVANEELETRLCGPEDREAQARLFNRCFTKRVEARHLEWRYDRNPHGRSVSLIARAPSGEAVCGYACSPRRALAFGDESTMASVGQTGDVMTDPDWRRRGIFSGLDRACMDETARLGWPIVFGLPNRRSAHIFLDLGWERIGTIRPWSHFLSTGPDARAERAREGRLRGLALPLAGLRSRKGRAALAKRAETGYVATPLERFPREVEEVSRAVEPDHAFMVRRDADYLDWRYCEAPSGAFRTLGFFDSSGALAGYVVVQPPRDDGIVGWLVDALGRDEGVRDRAVLAGIETLAAAGARVVRATAIDGSAWSRTLAASGFLPPRPENHLIVILWTNERDHPLAAAARDAAAWSLTDGDRDDETIG